MTEIQIREGPILFTPENVRKVLDGLKTQTRRVVKPQPKRQLIDHGLIWKPGRWTLSDGWRCPFGQVGDRLWVRERFTKDPDGSIYYAADGDGKLEKWSPSIHMPRWASRLTLEITEVRVERVQEISEADALAEGVDVSTMTRGDIEEMPIGSLERALAERLGEGSGPTPRYAFYMLWNSINAKRGYEWDKNPWVWALTFKKVE